MPGRVFGLRDAGLPRPARTASAAPLLTTMTTREAPARVGRSKTGPRTSVGNARLWQVSADLAGPTAAEVTTSKRQAGRAWLAVT